MMPFICLLDRYPNSFCELAINQDSSEWIHTLGLSLLYLNDFGIQRQLDMNNSQILFRVNSPKCTLIKPMQRNMTYKPIVTSNGSMDVPTSVEVNSTAKVLVYGTRCGTITFVELSTMRVSSLVNFYCSNMEQILSFFLIPIRGLTISPFLLLLVP